MWLEGGIQEMKTFQYKLHDSKVEKKIMTYSFDIYSIILSSAHREWESHADTVNFGVWNMLKP